MSVRNLRSHIQLSFLNSEISIKLNDGKLYLAIEKCLNGSISNIFNS